MSVQFNPSIAVKLRAIDGDGFIRNEGETEDYLFDLFEIEGQTALILNEHEFVWVDLSRIHVILNEPQPDADPGELEIGE